MTDDAEAYANAWRRVFGPPQHRLLFAWHVDRAWRQNLSKVAGDAVRRATIYKNLRVLLEQPDVARFSELMQQFLDACKRMSASHNLPRILWGTTQTDHSSGLTAIGLGCMHTITCVWRPCTGSLSMCIWRDAKFVAWTKVSMPSWPCCGTNHLIAL